MSKELLEIKNLSAGIENKEILHDINLKINEGEVHVLMGSNGSGKSTLANVILDNPVYSVNKGDILFENKSILDLSVDKRAKLGIFMTFQHPQAIEGITVENFIRTAKSKIENKNIGILEFNKLLKKYMDLLEIKHSYADRYLNVGFSGGEMKKNEILQLLILNPKLAILDETDSGLDIDAVRIVSKGIKEFMKEGNKSLLIITHHEGLLREINPNKVHVLMNGRLVKEGNYDLFNKIEENGYNWLKNEVK